MGLLLRSSPLRWSTEGEGVGVTVREGGTKLSIVMHNVVLHIQLHIDCPLSVLMAMPSPISIHKYAYIV